MTRKLVKVRHDETGDEAEVASVQVPGLEKRGWTVVDDGNKEQAADDAAPAPGSQTVEPETPVDEER